MKHQSCWAHLLRKLHEVANRANSSDEAKQLHAHLKQIYETLTNILKNPFNIDERNKLYKIIHKKNLFHYQ